MPGLRHFDADALPYRRLRRSSRFSRGCMRTYLILKEKAAQFNEDKAIQVLLEEINADDVSMSPYFGKYSEEKANALKAQSFNRAAIAMPRIALRAPGPVSH